MRTKNQSREASRPPAFYSFLVDPVDGQTNPSSIHFFAAFRPPPAPPTATGRFNANIGLKEKGITKAEEVRGRSKQIYTPYKMAKKKSKSRKSAGGAGKASSRDTYEDEEVDDSRLTLEALDAISTDSEDEGRGNGSKDEWDAEAAALRRAIAEGAFDRIGMNVEKKKNKGKKQKGGSKNDEDSDASEDYGGEEVVLEDESSDEEEEEEVEGGAASDSSDAGDDIAAQRKAELERVQKTLAANGKALRVVGDEMSAAHSAMPWSETFTVVPSNPMPFGGADGSALDVHDDLKREVAFYNTAMEGVIEARALCERSGIPFRRPDDFFAEMVKTDGTFLGLSFTFWVSQNFCPPNTFFSLCPSHSLIVLA